MDIESSLRDLQIVPPDTISRYKEGGATYSHTTPTPVTLAEAAERMSPFGSYAEDKFSGGKDCLRIEVASGAGIMDGVAVVRCGPDEFVVYTWGYRD